MAAWNEIRNRIAWLFRRRGFEQELSDEMAFHIEERAGELERGGAPAAEARLWAYREFGPALRAREESRAAWQFGWLEDLASDLRYAARGFRRNPVFAFTAAASLALGIGANTSIFSVAMEVLFARPSCRDAASLVQLSFGAREWFTTAEYRYLKDSGAFDGVAGINIGMVVNWRNGGRSWRLAGTHVTDNYFEVTGTPVAMGRPIAAGETQAAVITYGFWTRRLGSDPGVLGRSLTLDEKAYTIVGVLPRDHRMLAGFGFTPDLYLTKDVPDLALYGRLPRGLGRRAMAARLEPLLREMDRVFPDPHRKWTGETRLEAVDGFDRLGHEHGAALPLIAFFALLLIVTSLVLLIACANVSGLLLARAFSRGREIAIRISLGGSRGRIVRQLLAESLLLAMVGTGAGVLLNVACTRMLSGVRIPLPLPIEVLIRPDTALLFYSAAVAFAVTLATGLIPALKGTRASAGAGFERHARAAGPRGARLRNALVAGQLALSIVLLSAAVLFVRNLQSAAAFNAGFDTTRATVSTFSTTSAGANTPERFAVFVDAALARLGAIPEVECAAPATAVPLNPFLAFAKVNTEIRPDTRARAVRVTYNFNGVGPEYFRVLQIPLLEGRGFAESDRPGRPEVAILNENLARALFGGAGAVGHTIRIGAARDVRVVGVARNSRYVTLGEDNAMALYTPFAQQQYRSFAHFFVRTRGAPEPVVRKIEEALTTLDPSASVETRTLREVFRGAMLPSRTGAALMGAMSVFGLLLASVGLYGVLLYSVSRRVREIGIRTALGAGPRDILAMVAGESGALVAAGFAIGIFLAVFAVRPLAMFLVPEVRPADPLNFVPVAGALALVAALATVPPTLRALRIDPATALREE